MKNVDDILVDMQDLVEKMENFKHRVCHVKADHLMSDYEKMAKCRNLLMDINTSSQFISGSIKAWLEQARGRNGKHKQHEGMGQVAVQLQGQGAKVSANGTERGEHPSDQIGRIQ